MKIEVWLYGPLARFAGESSQGGYAQVHVELPAGATVGDLMAKLQFPAAEKGITFINGQWSDLPGLAADRDRELADGDRIGLFHGRSMWPYQYRDGASMTPELREALHRQGGALKHAYN